MYTVSVAGSFRTLDTHNIIRIMCTPNNIGQFFKTIETNNKIIVLRTVGARYIIR